MACAAAAATPVRRHSCAAACPSTLAPQSTKRGRRLKRWRATDWPVRASKKRLLLLIPSFLPPPLPPPPAPQLRAASWSWHPLTWPETCPEGPLMVGCFPCTPLSSPLCALISSSSARSYGRFFIFFPAAPSRLSVSNSFLLYSCLVILLAGFPSCFLTIMIQVVSAVALHPQLRFFCD